MGQLTLLKMSQPRLRCTRFKKQTTVLLGDVRQSKDKRTISGLRKVLPSLMPIRSPRDVQGLWETP